MNRRDLCKTPLFARFLRQAQILILNLVIILSAILIAPLKANAAFLYKSYTIRYDRGWDILCDPYVVQKNDWVLKLFRQKGEIAHKDFPEFLRIFQRINPHIKDVDRIQPGQYIMIPLRKLRQGSMPGQSTGIVTVPFVTISNIPEPLKVYSKAYKVQKGDCVSILIARKFGAYDSESYHEGIKLFRLINPDIADLDQIFEGQMIHIPDPSIRNQPWYASLFDPAAARNYDNGTGSSVPIEVTALEPPGPDNNSAKPGSPLLEAASILKAKFYNEGVYYFPRQGQEDFKLDLARMPFMELKDGTRLIFPQDNAGQESAVNVVRSFWKNIKVVQIAFGASAEQIFNSVFESFGIDLLAGRLSFADRGVDVETRGKWIIDEPSATEKSDRKVCISLIDNPGQRTPESITRYLEQHDIVIKDVLTGKGGTNPQPAKNPYRKVKNVVTVDPSDHRALVNDLLKAMGYQYAPNVSITFPYAQMQVKAVSNLVTIGNKSPLLIDFGDFYGDAVAAIKKAGFDIIQIKNENSYATVIRKLSDALGLSYANNPTFWAADRPAAYNTALTVPGCLVAAAGGPTILLADVPLDDGVIQLLDHQEVKVILLGIPARYL